MQRVTGRVTDAKRNSGRCTADVCHTTLVVHYTRNRYVICSTDLASSVVKAAMLCEEADSPSPAGGERQDVSIRGGHQRVFSYPHVQIEKQIDSFLETFKRRSAAAMERAQSLQGGSGGLLDVEDGAPPPGPLRSPK